MRLLVVAYDAHPPARARLRDGRRAVAARRLQLRARDGYRGSSTSVFEARVRRPVRGCRGRRWATRADARDRGVVDRGRFHRDGDRRGLDERHRLLAALDTAIANAEKGKSDLPAGAAHALQYPAGRHAPRARPRAAARHPARRARGGARGARERGEGDGPRTRPFQSCSTSGASASHPERPRRRTCTRCSGSTRRGRRAHART